MATGPQLVTGAPAKPTSVRERVLAEIIELRTDFWRRFNELEARVADALEADPQDAA